MERWEMALDTSNPTPIVTGFKTITAVFLSLKDAASPGVLASILTYDVSGGTVNVYAWKVTSSSVTTLVADTGSKTFSAMIWGTK